MSFQLSEEGPCEELGGDGQSSTFSEWMLPAKDFDGMWERFACNFLDFSFKEFTFSFSLCIHISY